MKVILNKFFVLKLVLYSALGYFIYLLLLITLQYFPLNDDVAFLNIKQDEIQLSYYKWAFFSHVFSSIFVILAGFTQFSATLRTHFIQLHRWSGKIYVFLVLFIAAPTGLIMAYHANGGIIAQVSFTILSVLWFYYTLKALLYIKKRNFAKHRNFMIRSYALTLSAVSLRLFKYLLIYFFELPPMDTYRIVSVLGWTVNLAVAELIIYKIAQKSIKSIS